MFRDAVQPVQKQRRASRACDFCHARGLKCRQPAGVADDLLGSCLTCSDYGVQCTMDRPVRKRGRKPTEPEAAGVGDKQSDAQQLEYGSLHAIRRLIQIYHDTIFPFVPESDLLTLWKDKIPDPDEPSYMLLMALCAVSCQTVALNAVFDTALLDGLPVQDSDQYFLEAVSKIPLSFPKSQHLDYLRSFGLLAVYSLHRGNHGDFHHYLGLYHALVAQHGFHDENRWPGGISQSDMDDRRRLFWCVYRLEIHSACVLGHMVRMPESQVSVLYPCITQAMESETQAWTAGWDYITDLFRLLEYAIFSLHGSKNRKPVLAAFYAQPPPEALLDVLSRLKAGKPSILSGLGEPDSVFQSNRCKYIAVQITCTETLVNIMALLYSHAPAREVMDVAERFLEDVTQAPLIMFKVAGNQIVHQLQGVGHMLCHVARHDSWRSRPEAKRLIVFMGNLVNSLQNDIPSAAKAGKQLLSLAGQLS